MEGIPKLQKDILNTWDNFTLPINCEHLGRHPVGHAGGSEKPLEIKVWGR
jgi:hypothetical protein